MLKEATKEARETQIFFNNFDSSSCMFPKTVKMAILLP
jgi:hypothetical protein